MNSIIRTKLTGLVLFWGFVQAFGVTPKYVFDLPKLESESSAIVVARVLNISDGGSSVKVSGSTLASSKHAVCEVLRSFKGTTEMQELDVFFIYDPMSPTQEFLSVGSTAVLFLKGSSDGSYTFTRPQHSKVPLADFDSKIDEPQISLRERIGAQLRPQLKSSDPAQIRDALDWGDLIGYYFPDAELSSLAASGNLDVQIASLARLFTRSNERAVSRGIELLTGGTDLTSAQVNDLAWALDEAPDTVSVPDAMRLARAQNAVVRRVAARILAAIAKPNNIRELIECLDASESRDAQYLVIRSLARLTGQKVILPEVFFAAPETYIAYWKNWYATGETTSQQTGKRTAAPDPKTGPEPTASKVEVPDEPKWFAHKTAFIGIAALVLVATVAITVRRK